MEMKSTVNFKLNQLNYFLTSFFPLKQHVI